MVFSSIIFVFLFLPIFLMVYYAVPARSRNFVLLATSLFFYFWGSSLVVLVLIGSVIVNYYVSVLIDRNRTIKPAHALGFGVCFNLFVLFYFKYTNFFVSEINKLLRYSKISPFILRPIGLPIGISFFTFQAISYLIDVYYKRTSPTRNVTDFGMYLSMFPQLIAGPIVRLSEIHQYVINRKLDSKQFVRGIERFSLGLGKKSLIANNVGSVTDHIFALPLNELTPALSWLGIICYTLQIYFDFSGYSDMAIGLGRMLGFEFPENFNQPYRAKSVTEFWRRWHMTLSRWFRDYVYIPLGGNRKGVTRTYLNLTVVFVLVGFWHGAAWNFIIWGIYHGILLTAERVLSRTLGFVTSGVPGIVLTVFLVMLGWVFFRAPDLTIALDYSRTMFGFRSGVALYFDLNYYLTPDKLFIIALGIFFALFPFEKFDHSLAGVSSKPGQLLISLKVPVSMAILVLSLAELSSQGFNPFIYFRF